MKCPYCKADAKPDWGAERTIHWFLCGTMTGNESSGRADQTQFCATVERGAMSKRIADLEAYAARLEAAGDPMADWLSSARNLGDDPYQAMLWRQAKESKP